MVTRSEGITAKSDSPGSAGPIGVVCSATDVDSLLGTHRRMPRRFVVAAPDLPAEECVVIQRRLERFAGECGCGVGAIVVTAAILAYSAYLLFEESASDIGGLAIWAGIGVVLTAALIGKSIGRAHAAWMLRRTLLELRERLLCASLRV